MKSYKTEFKRKLNKIYKEMKVLKNPKLEIENEKVIWVNSYVAKQVTKAVTILKEDPDEAQAILCEIPYQMVNPRPDVNTKEYKFIGNDFAYREFDELRHLIRMMPTSNDMSNQKIWNNVMVIRG